MKLRILTVLVIFSALLYSGCDNRQEIAKLSTFAGNVSMKTESQASFVPATVNSGFFEGGAVRTAEGASAMLELAEPGATVKVHESSYFEVRVSSLGFHGQGKAMFDVNRQNKEIVVETPHGVTAVLGTKFVHVIASDSFELWVEQGRVEFTSNAGQKRLVEAGHKLLWSISEPLPEPSEINLKESESFFGNEGYKFNRR